MQQRYPLSLFIVLLMLIFLSSFSTARAQTVVLYQNDFNSPSVTPTVTCGQNLNQTNINTLYGTPGFTFQQVHTAETVIINTAGYSDPSGRGGLYALGMLRNIQDDRLSLTLNGQGYDFVNIQMDITTINPGGCGIPVASGEPTFNVRVYDSPGGTFSIGSPGTMLDQDTVSGATVVSQTVYDWTTVVISLDISAATDYITVYWDVVGTAPYAIMDNLIITASSLAGSVGGVNISQTVPNSYNVVLTSVPTHTVVVTATPDSQCDLGAGAGNPIILTFQPDVSALIPQTVTVTPIDSGITGCAIAHTTTSTDPNYVEGTVVYTPSSLVIVSTSGTITPIIPEMTIPRVNVLGCALDTTDGVEVANAPDNTYCRVLMQNGNMVQYPGAIPAELVNLGVVLAVDIYRLDGGQYINTFPDYARICLEGVGRYFFLDSRNAPRVAIEMPSQILDNMTCAWVPAPGTAVLVNFYFTPRLR